MMQLVLKPGNGLLSRYPIRVIHRMARSVVGQDALAEVRVRSLVCVAGGRTLSACLLLTLTALSASTTAIAGKAGCHYYIAPAGSDEGAGTLSSPWKTIKYASAKLTPGEILCARGGLYYGQAGLIWKSSGTSKAPVTFRNYPGEKPVFDGEWGDTGTAGDFLVFSNNSYIIVDGITAQHYADRHGNGTVDLHNGLGPVKKIIIQNSTFIDNGSHAKQDHHVYVAAGVTDVTIRNNLFIRASGSAIQIYHRPASTGIRIYNNVMIGGRLNCAKSKANSCSANATQQWGIIVGDARTTHIYHNTIYGMEYGIDFNYGSVSSGPYFVSNNLIVKSRVVGLRITSPYADHFASDFNGYFGNVMDLEWKTAGMNAGQFAASTRNERHAVRADPMFVDAEGGNFRLKAGSPMIGRASATRSRDMAKANTFGQNRSYRDIGANIRTPGLDDK